MPSPDSNVSAADAERVVETGLVTERSSLALQDMEEASPGRLFDRCPAQSPAVECVDRLGPGWGPICMLACWLGWMAPAFGTSEVLQQFNAITSSDSFAGSITPPDPHGAVGPKAILASVNLGLAY